MKICLKICMLLLLGYQVNAQTIPTNPAVTVSYDSEVTTYKQVSSSADLNQLTDLEKKDFKRRVQNQHFDDYLTGRNETVRVITKGTREGYEGMGADPAVKVIIDQNGTSRYDASNRLINFQAASEKSVESAAEAAKLITKENYLKSPIFTTPTDAQIREARASGTNIAVNETGFSVKSEGSELIYNSSQKFVERKFLSEGKVVAVSQEFFTLNSARESIPSIRTYRTYETSENGVLIECVRVETLKNYSRIQN